MGLEQNDEAKALFEVALAQNGKLGRAREYLATYAMDENNTARVIELLEPVYREVQDRFQVLELLGRAYFREENYEKCIEILERAIVLRRAQPPMLNMLANALYREGNLGRAIELLQRSLAVDADQVGIQGLIDKVESERQTASRN